MGHGKLRIRHWTFIQKVQSVISTWVCVCGFFSHRQKYHLYHRKSFRKCGDLQTVQRGPGSVVGIATGYRLDVPGIKSRWAGGDISRTCPDQPWGPPSLLYNGFRVFPGGKEQPGRDADPSHLLVPWSWKGRAIPLLPLWAVQPVQSLSTCTRVTFTFITILQSQC